ncbi:hypothetical protein [Phaeovulum sp.]|uniref:hypothetical protein n=1 Tax=Phaeovulum sp. TaxID=2934796 RepID=UPI0039E459B5
MNPKSPADELATIRAEINRLKAREGELRAAYLTQPDLPRQGRWHQVELITHTTRVFDPRLLPVEVRNDPRFQRERVTRTLRTIPPLPPYPGKPTASPRSRSLFGHSLVH